MLPLNRDVVRLAGVEGSTLAATSALDYIYDLVFGDHTAVINDDEAWLYSMDLLQCLIALDAFNEAVRAGLVVMCSCSLHGQPICAPFWQVMQIL
jgi:hypothetical protein